jgi:hypothetical protein
MMAAHRDLHESDHEMPFVILIMDLQIPPHRGEPEAVEDEARDRRDPDAARAQPAA